MAVELNIFWSDILVQYFTVWFSIIGTVFSVWYYSRTYTVRNLYDDLAV